MRLPRSLFWKIFLIIWLTNMLLITAGTIMIRLEYHQRYEDLADNARIRSVAEYLISRYEAGMDTREFRRSSERSRIPRIVIVDQDTGLLVYTSHRNPESLDRDIYWDYVSPGNGRYRIYIEDEGFDMEEPDFPVALVGLAFLLTAAFSLLLTSLVTRPILKLRRHVEGLGNDLSAPLDARMLERQDEFGELARSVERMSERIRELIDSKQRLFFDISHELRAPLARMQVAAEIVRDRAESNGEADLGIYDRVDREIRALDQLITELMSFIKEDYTQLPTEDVDLHQLVAALVEDQDFASANRVLNTCVEIPTGARLRTKPVLLERAVRNLLENAIKYSPEDTPVDIEVSRTASGYRLCVNDSGPGIPEDQLQEVTQPFTRLHPESIEGVGLGLSIVVRAVEEIGGRLELTNRETGGLSACILIPE